MKSDIRQVLTELRGLDENSGRFVPSGGIERGVGGGREGKLWLVIEKLIYPRSEIHMLVN